MKTVKTEKAKAEAETKKAAHRSLDPIFFLIILYQYFTQPSAGRDNVAF